MARLAVGMVGLLIVEENLISGVNVAQSKKEQVSTDRAERAVGLARMVDELCTVACQAAINRPIGVETADMDALSSPEPPGCLLTGDAFADILGDLPPLPKWNRGKASSAIDR